MSTEKKGHSIVLDDKGQEQPSDKDRAQTAHKTEPGPPGNNDDELQPLREKNDF
jgi:hypothetical protein